MELGCTFGDGEKEPSQPPRCRLLPIGGLVPIRDSCGRRVKSLKRHQPTAWQARNLQPLLVARDSKWHFGPAQVQIFVEKLKHRRLLVRPGRPKGNVSLQPDFQTS
jgi:hypothetical protein